MEAFYGADEEIRMKLIKKIPLGILYRIKVCKEKKENNRELSTLIPDLNILNYNRKPK